MSRASSAAYDERRQARCPRASMPAPQLRPQFAERPRERSRETGNILAQAFSTLDRIRSCPRTACEPDSRASSGKRRDAPRADSLPMSTGRAQSGCRSPCGRPRVPSPRTPSLREEDSARRRLLENQQQPSKGLRIERGRHADDAASSSGDLKAARCLWPLRRLRPRTGHHQREKGCPRSSKACCCALSAELRSPPSQTRRRHPVKSRELCQRMSCLGMFLEQASRRFFRQLSLKLWR